MRVWLHAIRLYKSMKIQGPWFQRNYIIARDQKVILNGTSFQSSPKITRMLITKPICIQKKFTTPDHCSFANYNSYFFSDHWVVFTSSKVMNSFKW